MIIVKFTKTKEWSIDTIINLIKNQSSFRDKERQAVAFSIFSKLLEKYRYEILGTFEDYKIINNGYGNLKHIELENDIVIAEIVLYKLKKISNCSDITIEL